MSAIAAPAPGGAPARAKADKPGMSKGKKVGIGLALFWLLGIVFFVVVWGFQAAQGARSGMSRGYQAVLSRRLTSSN